MTWAQLRRLYLQAVGNTPDAQEEAFLHLSQGLRRVANMGNVDTPDLYATVQATVTADTDSIAVASLGVDVYAIVAAFSVSEGFPIYPEPSGLTGRQKFLQADTAKPPSGQITHYLHHGSSILFRDMPSTDTIISFEIFIQVPEIDESSLNDEPIVPVQYHDAIVHSAASAYFALHMSENQMLNASGQPIGLNSEKHQTLAQQSIFAPKPMRAEEDRPRRETMRLAGYQIGPKSRR